MVAKKLWHRFLTIKYITDNIDTSATISQYCEVTNIRANLIVNRYISINLHETYWKDSTFMSRAVYFTLLENPLALLLVSDKLYLLQYYRQIIK